MKPLWQWRFTAILFFAVFTNIHAQDLVIGQSVPLAGPYADIGRDMRDGAAAVFAQANSGKALPYRLKLVTLDNANNLGVLLKSLSN